MNLEAKDERIHTAPNTSRQQAKQIQRLKKTFVQTSKDPCGGFADENKEAVKTKLRQQQFFHHKF
jgi:hypothetical protein